MLLRLASFEQFAEGVKQLTLREGDPRMDERMRRKVYEVVAAVVKKLSSPVHQMETGQCGL